MKRTVFFVTWMALGVASNAQSTATSQPVVVPGLAAAGLTTQTQRITAEKILADRKTIDAMQSRLRKLSEAGVSQNYYPLAKAQCWLDTAKTQYHENDRSSYIEESLIESQRIVQALEADKQARVGFDTPLISRSNKLRDDLWVALAQHKTNDVTLACNARTVACGEVRLVRAGHADAQTGWRAATPHVMMVEDALRRADVEAARCNQLAAAQAALAAAKAAPTQPQVVEKLVTKETFVILADTLFRFDKAGAEDILPGGVERLNTVANRLRGYQSITSLQIVGHTDRLGSEQYNDALSKRRADTVLAYLLNLGLKVDKPDALGRGEREPVTNNCSPKRSRAEQIVCLQPDRRVTIEVTGVVK